MSETHTGHPALTDAVTGLPNRLHFDAVFAVIFGASDRGIPVSLGVLELDRFKDFREERGPAGVDDLLAKVAENLRRVTRTSDLLACVEPGRFFILLFDCNAHGARIAGDRFHDCVVLEDDPDVTASLGMATTNRGEMSDPEELIRAAQGTLEKAQALGGGQVEIFAGAST